MVKFGSHYATVAHIWRAGAVAAALTLGVTGLSAVSFAQQQPAAKKPPEKAPAAAGAKAGAAEAALSATAIPDNMAESATPLLDRRL